jgi:OPT oligopeptide transporter protein
MSRSATSSTVSFQISSLACQLDLTTCIIDFFPSYIFTALSYFSWVCWIVPDNVKINQLFGVVHGLGMGVVTFDWGQITAFNVSPLLSPWWFAANAGFSIIFFYWFLLPVLYVSLHFYFLVLHTSQSIFTQYSNIWYSTYLPLVSSQLFDNTGSIYNTTQIINTDGSFNLEVLRFLRTQNFKPFNSAIPSSRTLNSVTRSLVSSSRDSLRHSSRDSSTHDHHPSYELHSLRQLPA